MNIFKTMSLLILLAGCCASADLAAMNEPLFVNPQELVGSLNEKISAGKLLGLIAAGHKQIVQQENKKHCCRTWFKRIACCVTCPAWFPLKFLWNHKGKLILVALIATAIAYATTHPCETQSFFQTTWKYVSETLQNMWKTWKFEPINWNEAYNTCYNSCAQHFNATTLNNNTFVAPTPTPCPSITCPTILCPNATSSTPVNITCPPCGSYCLSYPRTIN